MTLDNDSKTRCKILVEVLIFCTVSALSILLEFGVMPEVERIGFYCGDPKISQKYVGDTITLKILLSSTILFPLLTICSVESSCYGTQGFAKRGGSRRAWWPQTLAWYREYLSGFLIVVFLTCVAKVLIGEPRPHFLDTCKPFQAINCTSGKFVSSYTCTNSEVGPIKIRDASKSFPSAHSALSVYLFIFSAWYLQRRMVGVSAVLVAWLQVVFLVWALVCCITRVTDHRHHWWDVLAGVLLGVILGVYTVYNFCCNFQVRTYKNLSTTKSPDKTSNNLFKGRLLTTSSDTAAQGLADVTPT